MLKYVFILSSIILSGFSFGQVVFTQNQNDATIGLDRKAWAGVGNTGNHSDGYAHDFTLPQSTSACEQITGITVSIVLTGHNTNNVCPSNTVYYNLYYGCTTYTAGATCLPGTSLIAEPNYPPNVSPPQFNFGNPLGGPVNPGLVPQFGGNLSVDIIPVSNPGCNAVSNGHISYQYTITVTVTIANLAGPEPPLACYQTATLDSAMCLWTVDGVQPTEPPAVNCWDNFVFDTASCTWENTGTPINLPTIDLGPDQIICAGQSTTLNAPAGFDSYLWSNGATTQSITVNQSGTYSVTGTVLSPASTNLINNPGFDSGNTGFTTNYTVGTGGTWGLVSNGSTYAIVNSPNLAHNHLANCPYQGNMFVANGGNSGNNANVWCQTVNITPNTNYIFSVDAINPHNNAGWGVLPLTLNLVINGTVSGSLTPPLSPNNCAWQTYSSSVWNSGANTSVTLCVQNATNGANLLAIDNLSFTPVVTCTQTDSIDISVVNAITPTFNAIGPYCIGSAIPALPTSSTNTTPITGTWSPALNNTATTTYTFTPNPGQCAENQTMTIEINASVTPSFTQVAPICSGAALTPLPTTSNNGITGTWSPALNNTSTTTYTFTPTASLCATSQTMTVVVNPNVTPSFTQVNPICSGAALAPLPTTSNNGIAGTWSPAVNNTQTTTYTFTSSGLCSPNQTMTIVVNPAQTPTFTQVNPICNGENLSALPTTSNNGITGAWSPVLNNTATTTYTFTPTAGLCASSQTMEIVVNPSSIPLFAAVNSVCVGGTIAPLPTTSLNGITGTWSPALNNQQTTTYTFSPNSGQCAETTELVITITPQPAPPIVLCYQTATWNAANCQWDVSGTPLPVVNAGVDQNICQGDFVTLSASGSGTYQWNNGVIDGVPFVQNVPVQTYTVIGVDAFGCVSEDQVTVTLVNAPVPAFSLSETVSCDLPFEVLISNTTNGNIENCSWDFGNGNIGSNCDGGLITYNSVGCYDITLSITDANGCTNSATSIDAVCVLEQPTAAFTAEPAIQDVAIPINFFNYSTGANAYTWNFGNNSSTNSMENANYTYTEAGYFTVTLIAFNALGCADTAFLNVEIKDPLLFYVPNSFTPDGKNYNEMFVPIMTSGFDPSNYELSVFNRWGELVFVSQHPAKGWDGTYGGMLCPEGVYIWQIRVRNIDGVFESHQGHVNLLR